MLEYLTATFSVGHFYKQRFVETNDSPNSCSRKAVSKNIESLAAQRFVVKTILLTVLRINLSNFILYQQQQQQHFLLSFMQPTLHFRRFKGEEDSHQTYTTVFAHLYHSILPRVRNNTRECNWWDYCNHYWVLCCNIHPGLSSKCQ